MSRTYSTLPFYLSPEDPPAKQKLLQEALKLFVNRGYCETSIRDIADAAGYTNPALFKHFAGKDALAQYLFELCYERYAVELRRKLDATADFSEGLHQLVARFCELLDEDGETFLYMNDNLRRFWPHVRPAMRKQSMIALLRGLVQQGVQQKAISRGADLDVLVAGFSGTLIQFARMHYFSEFKGSARDWAGKLERAMLAMATG